jgi:hypothetical protein
MIPTKVRFLNGLTGNKEIAAKQVFRLNLQPELTIERENGNGRERAGEGALVIMNSEVG